MQLPQSPFTAVDWSAVTTRGVPLTVPSRFMLTDSVTLRPLLKSLGKELQMSVAQLPAATGERFQFEELKLRYSLSDDGALKLLGGSRYAEGALLVDANGVLLREPPTTQETAGLIRALATTGSSTLPTGARTAMLSRVLPIRGESARAAHFREPAKKTEQGR